MSIPLWKQLDLSLAGAGGDKLSPDDNLEAHCQRISGYLTIRLPEPVDVVFTNNRSTMVSFQRRGGRIVVRLHRLFRHADTKLLESLALYLGRRDKNASAILDKFIEAHQEEVRSPVNPRKKLSKTQGRYHDLSAVLDRVIKTYFGGKVDVRIVWGRALSRRKKRCRRTMSRALATYSFDEQLIRVSPVLDAEDVPDRVIEWIVYHEVLHHVLPVEENGKRRNYHTSRFKTLERAFIHYEEARAWEKAHRSRLLS